MSLDPFLDREYDRRAYNCTHFTREVWLHLTGEDLADRFGPMLGEPESRAFTAALVKRFERLAEPISPCLAMMRRPRTAPHIGVFYRGRIIHLHERGAEFLPPVIAFRGFRSVAYYR